jgi:hypothetical protein
MGQRAVGVVASSQVVKERGVGAIPAVAMARSEVADHQTDSRWQKNVTMPPCFGCSLRKTIA